MKRFPSQQLNKGGHRAPSPMDSQQGPHSLGPPQPLTGWSANPNLQPGSRQWWPGKHQGSARQMHSSLQQHNSVCLLRNQHRRHRCLSLQVLLAHRSAGGSGCWDYPVGSAPPRMCCLCAALAPLVAALRGSAATGAPKARAQLCPELRLSISSTVQPVSRGQ